MRLDRIPNYVGVNLMFIFNRNYADLLLMWSIDKI